MHSSRINALKLSCQLHKNETLFLYIFTDNQTDGGGIQ